MVALALPSILERPAESREAGGETPSCGHNFPVFRLRERVSVDSYVEVSNTPDGGFINWGIWEADKRKSTARKPKWAVVDSGRIYTRRIHISRTEVDACQQISDLGVQIISKLRKWSIKHLDRCANCQLPLRQVIWDCRDPKANGYAIPPKKTSVDSVGSTV